MKVALLNDTHAGARGSSDIFIEYQRRFYREVFFPYLKENEIKNIWHLGDFFDNRKAIDFKALHANRKMFLEPLVANGMHMTIIPGNHDTVFKNTLQICSLKELLGFFTENVTILMEPTELSYGASSFLWVPWINSENHSAVHQRVSSSKADVLLGHLELGGFDMNKGIKSHHSGAGEKSIQALLPKFKKVLTGHFHTKSTRDNIHYLGAQMQFTWADCDDPKFFHVLDTETLELTPVRNPIEMFAKIRYRDGMTEPPVHCGGKYVRVIIEEKKNAYQFDRFIEKIENQEPIDIKTTDAANYGDFTSEGEDSIISSNELKMIAETPDAVATFIDDYIDNVVETETLDKARLKSMMQSIAKESENTTA